MNKNARDPLLQVLYTLVVAAIFFTFGYYFKDALDFGKTEQESSFIKQEVDVNETSATVTTVTTTTASKSTKATKTTVAVNYPLSVNTATKEELMTIKGIGETYAQRIVDYREKIGGFTDLDQLMEVKGIGEGRLAKWKPYLKL